MPLNKRSSGSKTDRRRPATKGAAKDPAFTLGLPSERGRSNGTRYEKPLQKISETDEEREKRLEKREELTLRAFEIAYRNHHQRKTP